MAGTRCVGFGYKPVKPSPDVKATHQQGQKWAGLPLAKTPLVWLSRAQNSNQKASV